MCRIRFDFTSLVLADPKTDTTTDGHTAATGDKESVGDCITDTFQIIGWVNFYLRNIWLNVIHNWTRLSFESGTLNSLFD